MTTKKRKIYFAASITDQNKDLAKLYTTQLKELLKLGSITNSTMYTPQEETLTSDEIYVQTEEYLDKAEILVADVSSPSHGVGREIAYAQYVKKIPVLCIYKRGSNPSPLLEGNEYLHVFPYQTEEDLQHIIQKFFTQRL